MSKIIEITTFENQEVAAGEYPDIELVMEYRNPEKPKFDWNLKDNLIACIQFSPCQPFPENLFQRFIVERQAEAFFRKVDIEEPEPERDESAPKEKEEIEEPEPERDESAPKEKEEIEEVEFPSYLEDNWIKTMEMEVQPKPIDLKRFIWANGIYIAKEEGKYQVVVEKEAFTRRIIVKCSGKSEEARNYFENLIDRFRSTFIQPDVFVICTCSICQQRGLHGSHWIKVRDLENLKRRYEPKIQCYGSGKMIPLDEISTVKQPVYDVVIINAPADDPFCEKAEEHFFPPNSLPQPNVSTRNQKLRRQSGNPEDEYRHRVRNADVIVSLISLKLTGGKSEGDILARKMVEIAVERFGEKKCLCLFVCINDPSNGWENISPFSDVEIPILNQSPIYSLENTQSWKHIGDDLHRKISNWLKIKANQND